MQQEKPSQKRGRSAMEKLRRAQMKHLYSELASLLPSQPSQEKVPLPALVDRAFNYVKGLKEKIDDLKVKKERLQGLVVPAVVVNENGSFLEVNLLTGLCKSFILREALIILEEEGAVVLDVTYATMSDRILYTIRSQAFSTRIGIGTPRVHEQLKSLLGLGLQHHPSNELNKPC